MVGLAQNVSYFVTSVRLLQCRTNDMSHQASWQPIEVVYSLSLLDMTACCCRIAFLSPDAVMAQSGSCWAIAAILAYRKI
jgi:hypothetical protein